VTISWQTNAAPTDAWALLKRHGKSFAWAARLLPRQQASHLARLYALCRMIDDLADEDGSDAAVARLIALRQQDWRLDSPEPMSAQFAALGMQTCLARTPVNQLIDGVLGDLNPVLIADQAGLIRYAYHVAGTVGLMVCDVLAVKNSDARASAIDLGIAMQLTNIARDVMQDAQSGRRYLPATWVDASPAELVAPTAQTQTATANAVLRLLDLADRYYANASFGFAYLPLSSRLGMAVAAHVYHGIGTELRRRGGDYTQGRAYVSGWRKVILTAQALAALLRQPSGAHAPDLHQAIIHLIPQDLRTTEVPDDAA
jgi:15-cis-phytoene synthase